MITVPKFDLSKEKTRTLWLGLAFFTLLALLLMVRAALPYLSGALRPSRAKAHAERRLERQGVGLPSAEEMMRQAEREEQGPDILAGAWYLAGSIILIAGTVVPIARELKRRRRQG